jgi:regulator of cell morphogenesis and NO signaling
MEKILKSTVGAVVAENFRTASVFAQFGIDFCCKGGITLEEACLQKKIQLEELIQELQGKAQKDPEETDFRSLSQADLIDYIVSVHHAYVREFSPQIKNFLEKLCSVHGENHPELFEIKNIFAQVHDSMLMHMMKEERILFPFIKSLLEAQKKQSKPSNVPFGHIENPIKMMELEHEAEGERLRKIAALCEHYTPPADACQTYKTTLSMLQAFEADLHKHIHLENNILFPRARCTFNEVF